MVDVAIVGYGPVGATLAILLAQRGWRVVVMERWAEPYPLPRAVHFDHEAGRILQSCGIGEALTKISEPADIYEFQNAELAPLVRFGRVGNGLSGWPQSSMFSQPELEALLFARVGELSGIEVRRGVQVAAIEDDGAESPCMANASTSSRTGTAACGCGGRARHRPSVPATSSAVTAPTAPCAT